METQYLPRTPEHGQRSPTTEPLDTHAPRAPLPPLHPPRLQCSAPPAPSRNGSVAPPVEGAVRNAEPARGAAGRTAGQAAGRGRRAARSASARCAARARAPAAGPPRRGRRRHRALVGRRHRRGWYAGRADDTTATTAVASTAAQAASVGSTDAEMDVSAIAAALKDSRVHRNRGHCSPATSGSVSASSIGFAIVIDTARSAVDELTGETI
jgi:hypothetical protein